MTSATPLAHLSLVLAMLLTVCLTTHAAPHVRSPSGRHLLAPSLLASRLHPQHDRSLAADLLYEHTPDGLLLSNTARLSVHHLAPNVTILPVAGIAITVNGRRVSPSRGPTLRSGPGHAFVYDYVTGNLIAGWGPTLDLRPVHLERHPNVFVNVHPSTYHHPTRSSHGLNLLHTSPPSRSLSLKANPNPIPSTHSSTNCTINCTTRLTSPSLVRRQVLQQFRPRWTAERPIFFDVSFGFDASFCKSFVDSGGNATQVVHASGVEAHTMSLTRIVSVRINAIVGFCEPGSSRTAGNWTDSISRDRFRAPYKWLASCTGGCSRPVVRLKSFRVAWLNLVPANVSDAAYLMSDDRGSITPGSNIVGSAWVGSACSSYSFGWVLGNHPVVLAHEMGHTLGAPHDPEGGLMRSRLNITKASLYSPKSLHKIDEFLSRLQFQGCMVSRTQAQNVGGTTTRRVFTGFTRLLRSSNIVGTDVALGTADRFESQVDAAMLFMQKGPKGNNWAGLRLTTVFRAAKLENPDFPFYYNYSFVTLSYIRGTHITNYSVGGGLAAGRLRPDSGEDDLIATFMRKDSAEMIYVVGVNLDSRIGVLGGWLSPKRAPVLLGYDVRAMGSTMGILRSSDKRPVSLSRMDLIVTYIVHTEGELKARCLIGYDLNEIGFPLGGWAATPFDIPFNFSGVSDAGIGDISVAIWEPLPSENVTQGFVPPRLLFALTVRENGSSRWRTRVAVAYGPWEYRKPPTRFMTYEPNIPSREAHSMSGGIALTSLRSTSATSVVFEHRGFRTGGSSQWIVVGDGILTREKSPQPQSAPQLGLALGEHAPPGLVCSRCYTGGAVNLCKDAVGSCFAHRQASDLGQVSALRMASTVRQTFTPSVPSLFCEGFHSLFIKGGAKDDCEWSATRTKIIAQGVKEFLLKDIIQFHSGFTSEEEVESNVAVVEGALTQHLLDISNGGVNGPNRIPVAVKLWFRPKEETKRLRAWLIRRAIKLLRRKPDFSSFYSNAWLRTAKVERKGGKRFVVILQFNARFKEEYVRDVGGGR